MNKKVSNLRPPGTVQPPPPPYTEIGNSANCSICDGEGRQWLAVEARHILCPVCKGRSNMGLRLHGRLLASRFE